MMFYRYSYESTRVVRYGLTGISYYHCCWYESILIVRVDDLTGLSHYHTTSTIGAHLYTELEGHRVAWRECSY